MVDFELLCVPSESVFVLRVVLRVPTGGATTDGMTVVEVDDDDDVCAAATPIVITSAAAPANNNLLIVVLPNILIDGADCRTSSL